MMFTAAALVMASFSVNAQEAPQLPPPPHHEGMDAPMPPKMHHGRKDRLADELKLTDTQRQQAEKIRKEGWEKVKPLMDQMRDLREKMDEMRENNMKEFEKILTPEQKTEFNKIKTERKAHKSWKKMHKGDRGVPGEKGAKPLNEEKIK